MKFFYLIFLLILCKYADPYPNGAPVQYCDEMIPQHGADPIKSVSPFTITYSANNLTRDFNVIISSPRNASFKGFLLQARGKWNGKPIGEWKILVRNTKALACSGTINSGVTHTWPDDDDLINKSFKQASFKWVPPLSRKLNRVKFIATVVQSYRQIYLNVSTEMKLKSYGFINDAF